MFGPPPISYVLLESGLVQPKFEILTQVAVIVGATALSADRKTHVVLVFSAVSIVLMMDAVAFTATPFATA